MYSKNKHNYLFYFLLLIINSDYKVIFPAKIIKVKIESYEFREISLKKNK